MSSSNISMQSFTHSLQMATLVAPTIIFVTSFLDLEQKEQTNDSSVITVYLLSMFRFILGNNSCIPPILFLLRTANDNASS